MPASKKKASGVYLVAVGAAVLVQFVVYTLYASDNGVADRVWLVLDSFMAVGLVLALWLSGSRKCQSCGDGGDAPVTQEWISANVIFYVNLTLAIMFAWNWVMTLQSGIADPANHVSWNFWTVIDTVLPIAFGVTGLRELRD